MRLNYEGSMKLITASFMLFFFTGCLAVKIRYTSDEECDRYSVDALYNEKYKAITENIFKDTVEFVSRVSDLMSDSLITALSHLPDKDSSDNEERQLHSQFETIKKKYSGKTKKDLKNITTNWEDLVSSNFDLLYDNGKCSLSQYLGKVTNLTDAYGAARKSLDLRLEQFITFIKNLVRDGLHGIAYAAEDSLKKEKKQNKKDKKEQKEKEKPEDIMKKKKLEIIDMVTFGFLKKVSAEVVKQNMDLYRKVTIKPEDRDSVLDDVIFDMILIKSRMRATIYDDMPKEKGSIDLARRSIYTYWAELAEEMYKEKIQSKKTTTPGGKFFYKKLWSNETEIVETLLNLMEVYP